MSVKREDPLQQFETGRIKHLQEERLHIQKKTFTKWMNSFLSKARLEVKDLFTDLADGKMMLRLLEIISGEKLGKPNNGKMRVHKVENVNKSLAFLHTKVRLESIGAEDIVDGNPRLILGLIWTIILRFQIQEIEIQLDEENESSEKKSAKDALLLWCQRKTAGYKGVNIVDFTTSWRSGLGFNALIHAHRPDLIDYDSLNPRSHIDNLNNAFQVANEELGIARILDAEDVDTSKPDEKSIITYVASYYHTFARMRDEVKGGRRIANIMHQMKDVDDSINKYETITTCLLEWIKRKIEELDNRDFPNSLDGIRKLLIDFKLYRTEEKPPKYKERSEIEALFFVINASLKALNQPIYCPQEGQLIHDLEREWQKLEKAEHRREVALRDELLRQERLLHLAEQFEKKSVLRKGYLTDMIQVLSDPRYGSDLSQIDATVKKHEAISADILAREDRFKDLEKMADKLESENYNAKDVIRKKQKDILDKWEVLLRLLEQHQLNLNQCSQLMAFLREADTVQGTIKELESSFRSDNVGRHLLSVEDLLQKHSLMESQVMSLGDAISKLNKQCEPFLSLKHKEVPLLQKKMNELNEQHKMLLERSVKRRILLEESRDFYQFLADMEEEEAWVVEKQRICQAAIIAKDLRAVISLQQKHKALEDEMKARRPKYEKIVKYGIKLLDDKHPNSPAIREQIDELKSEWGSLDKVAAERRKQLEDAAETYSFYTDANEVESWVKEKLPLVESNDYGEDETSARALLQRHTHLEGEIKAYEGDIKSLNSQGEKLVRLGISALNLSLQQPLVSEDNAGPDYEWAEETKLIPQEFWEEMPVERIEEQMVLEEKLMDTVIARYPFDGQGMTMKKGEIMFLINKTNNDWWNVRKPTGEEGFVPANYVREGEPKQVRIKVKKPVKIREMQRVKRTKMVKQTVSVKRPKPKAPPRSKRLPSEETVDKRLNDINDHYTQLVKLAAGRHQYLEESIKLFGFFRECSEFESWMREQERILKESPTENVDAAKRQFEKCLTDMSAASKRIEDLDRTVEEDFVKTGHSQLYKVKARQKQIHDQWAHLNRLKQQKERSLEGASSVELFHRTCDEAKDWMIEKMEKLDTDELGRDLKTVQSLQRKHEQLERELAPVEEKVRCVSHLGNSVRNSYPNEKKAVDTRQKEIDELWHKLKGKAGDKRNRLEEAVGKQIFLNSTKSLLSWVADVKDSLNADEAARDVATAEQLLKAHQDLGDDIRAHQDEFDELNELGQKLVRRNPDFVDVADKLTLLNEEEKAIHRGWREKGDWLRQCMDLQLFNREADQIDAATSSHEAFLEFNELGNTLDGVEALLKRHDDFENTLMAQDERLRTFSDMADKLLAAKHYDSEYIKGRRDQVKERRNSVKDASSARKAMLHASQAYQQFKADADEFDCWINEKKKLADDESYRDLSNLERKLQKHEAFERELRANEGQLRHLNKSGNELISMKHYRSDDIQDTLAAINSKWKDLCAKSKEKGKKLKQASEQHGFNSTLEETAKTLDALESVLKNNNVGSDLRSCKDLLNRHSNLENDMNGMSKKINETCEIGNAMVHDNHFDAENILVASRNIKDKFESLKGPAAERRAALEESLRFYEFNFEIDAELQWVKDHVPAATSELFGQNLHEAQNLQKKHRKLEAEIRGHQPQIDKVLRKGDKLITDKHPEENQIEKLCSDLREAWEDLELAALERNRKLELSLRAQQFFFEANEVEAWMGEKRDLLQTRDYGKDEDVARKLLAKHKAIELEIDTYSGLVKEMGSVAEQMVKTNHPESKLIKDRQQVINQEMKELQKLSTHLRTKLMESMYRHEYFREAEELEKWISEQLQVATSEDYGQDYEHLLLLQAKYEDYKHRVDSGVERFNQCDELAKKLVANASPYAAEIERKQEALGLVTTSDTDPAIQVIKYHEKVCVAWNNLLDQISNRDQKLEAAGEIHRFNRDVGEALSRINEKYESMSDYLGRDMHSVQSLLRKHEGFENDLVALEAQLQVLVDDSARLQATYPGTNADHISEQQALVIENWNALQDRASQRKEELLASLDLQKFLADSRDLMSWSSDLRASMKTQEKVRDASSAQALKTEHEGIKAEIEAREDTFSRVVEAGRNMIEDDHYTKNDIEERVARVLEERNQLHATWQHKKIYLDQLIDLQFFLRDAKQLDSISSSQEAALNQTDYGIIIEEVDALVKKHDAFEKLVLAQDEKLESLKMHGAKLIEQNHFYSPDIKSRIVEVTDRRNKVKEATHVRKQQLEDALLFAQFTRDSADADIWINEKKTYLEAEKQTGEVTSFEEKVKKLKKHQAFMAELQAHETMIKEITDKGTLLLKKQHKASQEIKEDVDKLIKNWTELVLSAENYSRGLEEAQDILEFNTQIDKVVAWIRDKEMMVQARDLGKDYEHCMALHRKLDDVDSNMRVDDKRFTKINGLADKIISQGRGNNKSVNLKRIELNNKWKALKGSIDKYRQELSGALEIHGFSRDVDDTNARINEKSAVLASEETGKDLAHVETLQRKQESVIREISAIEKKIVEHEKEAYTLSRHYPEKKEYVETKLGEVQELWTHLCDASHSRKNQLGKSYTLHKFQSDLKELQKWADDINVRINSSALPTSIAEAEGLLHGHQELKAEIKGRKDVFEKIDKFADKLITEEDSYAEVIKSLKETIMEIENKVIEVWEDRDLLLRQAHQLQQFLEMAEQSDSWLASKEAFLNNDDLGDSMCAVEALIRKHEGFEKSFHAQENKIYQLIDFSDKLLNDDHYDKIGIKSRIDDVASKKVILSDSAEKRRLKLQESKALQQFLRNTYEVEAWLTERLQVACDDSYRDPTNLQSKIQKHGAFEAEVLANSGRVRAVTQEGDNLISAGHFAAQEIQMRLDGLDSLWTELQDAASLKKERLNEAYQALLFNRNLDDFETWMEDIESQLQSEDHGKDLTSVQNLLMKHHRLEADVTAHLTDMEQSKEVGHSLAESGHFMKEEILERVDSSGKRYEALHEPIQIRKENLEDALLFQQLLRDIEDEVLWLREKDTLASSEDLGSSLHSVQNLQKKHQALEAEIQSHEPVINSVNSRAQQMVRSGHFAASDIDEKSKHLLSCLTQIKDLASVRRLRLADALESQMFYTEANEAIVWMKERGPQLSSTDYGKDENSVEVLLKKLHNTDRDLDSFLITVNKLEIQSGKLIERAHFDADNISLKIDEVKQKYEELKLLKSVKCKRLAESQKLFRFLRDCDRVGEWLNDQMVIAASEDYGRDVEHIETLIQKFDSFLILLLASEEKLAGIKSQGRQLLDENHPEPNKINERIKELQQLWEDVKEVSQARQEALAGAKQVHVFDRNADETISWIGEKDAIISSEDYGHDLETVQGLMRRHQVFERDLAAVKEQIESVVDEAKKLVELFPDAREHIAIKHEETIEAWNDLLEKSAQRKDRLSQAEQLQSYFDHYRELMAWINEMLAKITSHELPKDVAGCENLISRHKEYKNEVDSHVDALEKFNTTGNKLIEEGHFMAEVISEKIATLNARSKILIDTLASREVIYKHNVDLQEFHHDAQLIENWIESRESIVKDDHFGDSINEVEELVRRHEDFLKTLDAQDDKIDLIKRFTLVEAEFQAQKKREEEARKAEAARKEQEKIEVLKRKEVQRITDERRKEDERRRTQEIKFTKEELERARITMNGDYSKSSSHLVEGETSRRMIETTDSGILARSGSQTSLGSAKRDVKRAESMRTEVKKSKRTPSFTTRRRTQSFRKHKRMENLEDLPPVEIKGYLERKQELQTGGKKATIRSWKTFYTVLCGQLLCYFKDEDDFFDQKAASPPVSIFQARVEKAVDYTKKKNVFRLITQDGAEFLFCAESDMQLDDWITKLSFHAQLPPSMQLMSYDTHKVAGENERICDSDNSSEQSTPEMHRIISTHPKGAQGGLDITRPHSQSLDNPLYANLEHMQDKAKPPVPPRVSTSSNRPISQSPISEEGPIYQNRISIVPSYEVQVSENAYENYASENTSGHRRSSSDNYNGDDIPPLPNSNPPFGTFAPVPPVRGHFNQHPWRSQMQGAAKQPDALDGIPGSRQPYSEYSSRTGSLPVGSSLVGASGPPVHRHSTSFDRQGGQSESSSEGEPPSSGREKKRSLVFKFFGRNKGAQV